MIGIKKSGYDAFYGIAFARPPVGNLRFRVIFYFKNSSGLLDQTKSFYLIPSQDPVPSPWWMGTYKAIVPKLFCWQFDSQIFPLPPSGTEDCLYMNIYRPRVNPKRPLNVVVFIHGGGFYSGNNSPLLYGPEFFMETGQVILVTIAYRLNVFGFLATGDAASPGNYGLKDQTMALRWINQHIGAFGGDPNAVTLMGQSAGSVAVNYHLVSKHSEGLYKNAIMLSGTVESPWAQPRERPRSVVNSHARALGIQNAARLDSMDLVEVFRKIPAKDLTSTVIDLYKWENLPVAAYLPVVEPPDTPDPFLTVHPRIALAQGDFVKVPVMTSITHGDGMNFIQPIIRLDSRYGEFNANMYSLMPVVLEMDQRHPNMTAIVSKVRARYFGRRGTVSPKNFDSVVRMSSDYHFGRPLFTTCQAMARHTPVFVHKLDYKGLNSISTFYTRTLRNYGVVHADDLMYLFRMVALFPYQLTPEDQKVQQAFMAHVMSFVKYSYPGYPAWNVNAPTMMRFSRSKRADVKIDQVYVKRHEFWRHVRDMYEKPWDRPWIGNFSWYGR